MISTLLITLAAISVSKAGADFRIIYASRSRLILESDSIIYDAKKGFKRIVYMEQPTTYVRLAADRRLLLTGNGTSLVLLRFGGANVTVVSKPSAGDAAFFRGAEVMLWKSDERGSSLRSSRTVISRIASWQILAECNSGAYLLASRVTPRGTQRSILAYMNGKITIVATLPREIGHDFGVGSFLYRRGKTFIVGLGEHPDLNGYSSVLAVVGKHISQLGAISRPVYAYGMPFTFRGDLYISVTEQGSMKRYLARFSQNRWTIAALPGADAAAVGNRLVVVQRTGRMLSVNPADIRFSVTSEKVFK